MDLEKIGRFEEWSLYALIWNMIKWYNYEHVDMQTYSRPEVASRIWIRVVIYTKLDEHGLPDQRTMRTIDGQNPDIVQRRLVEFLYSQHPKK